MSISNEKRKKLISTDTRVCPAVCARFWLVLVDLGAVLGGPWEHSGPLARRFKGNSEK